jgi:hypothetical protein
VIVDSICLIVLFLASSTGNQKLSHVGYINHPLSNDKHKSEKLPIQVQSSIFHLEMTILYLYCNNWRKCFLFTYLYQHLMFDPGLFSKFYLSKFPSKCSPYIYSVNLMFQPLGTQSIGPPKYPNFQVNSLICLHSNNTQPISQLAANLSILSILT